jgi:hypothetical protein
MTPIGKLAVGDSPSAERAREHGHESRRPPTKRPTGVRQPHDREADD